MNRHLAITLLSSYMDEEVTPAQLRLVEGHLGGCADCRTTLAGLRAVAAGVRRLEAVAPPPALAAAVERRVRLASLEESSRFRLEDGLKRWAGQPVLAPIFAIILALGAILYLFAFGVSKGERHTTRFVVAAAPSEDNTDSLAKRNELRTESEVPASKTDLVRLGGADGPARSEVSMSPRTSESKSPPERARIPSARSRAVPGLAESAESAANAPQTSEDADFAADRRQELTAKFEDVSPHVAAEVVAPAQPAQVAKLAELAERAEKGETAGSRALPEFTPHAIVEPSLTAGTAEVRELAGHRFVREHGIWIEVGVAGEPVAEVLDLRQDSVRLEVDLSAFRELERVRLRIDDRVVEVIYPEG